MGKFTFLFDMRFFIIYMILSLTGISFSYSQEFGEVRKLSFSSLQKEISNPTNKLKVVNFWATWCKPCIEEMPYFEEVGMSFKEDVEIYFVSLDFPEELSKVKKFQEKKGLTATVILLDEVKYDYFMPKISPEWTGAIPATLFVDKEGNKYFYEKPFSKKELSEVVTGFIN